MRMALMSLSERLIIGTWKRPFPYLFHRWKVTDNNGIYLASYMTRTAAWAHIEAYYDGLAADDAA